MVCFLGLGTIKSMPASSLPVLLTINDSDPSAVTITATTSNSYADYSGNTANDGIDLLGFFAVAQSSSEPPFGQFLPGSTLEGGGIGDPYNDVMGDDYSTLDTDQSIVDLEVYLDVSSPGETDTENFSTSQPAFTGSWTIDFSNLGITSGDLPAAGMEGTIISGYSFNAGAPIGQWEVVSTVPEPGANNLIVLGAGLAGLAIYRTRNRAKAAK